MKNSPYLSVEKEKSALWLIRGQIFKWLDFLSSYELKILYHLQEELAYHFEECLNILDSVLKDEERS